MPRPEPTEYAAYFAKYIANVPEDDIIPVLSSQLNETRTLLHSIGDQRADFRYEPGKWSVKELVGHVTDTERVFTYRAMAIARGEQQNLPGFEQDEYLANAGFDRLPFQELIENYLAVRRASLLFFQQLPEDAWSRRGTASGNPVTVRALAYMTVGHERHHVRILRERYL